MNLKRVGSISEVRARFHGHPQIFRLDEESLLRLCARGRGCCNFLQKRLGEWPGAVRWSARVRIAFESARREGPTRASRSGSPPTLRLTFRNPVDILSRAGSKYLSQRDISREVADQFGMGFAPREIGLLRNYMNTLGFDEARLVAAGLLIQGDDGSEPRPRFRARLMFPILDSGGRNIGFGGRLIGPGEPKYLNSAESPVFSKGKTLYGLNWAKNDVRREDQVLVVEGYFDVVRLMAAGVTTVVAAMGTALTDAQAAMLRKLTKNVFLLYDSDKAGLQATFRSGTSSPARSVRESGHPAGWEDPDTFVKAHAPTP